MPRIRAGEFRLDFNLPALQLLRTHKIWEPAISTEDFSPHLKFTEGTFDQNSIFFSEMEIHVQIS